MLKLPSKVFVTGTDTEIGKTYTTCRMLRSLRTKNKIVQGIKPLVSGGLDDIENLSAASSYAINRYLYYFQPAIAPHIAALEAGVKIDVNKIIDFMRADYNADHTLIEGFGGWYAPISDHATMAECVIAADLPVVLVVGMKLGCINHAILSARAIKRDGANIIGWVANALPPRMPYFEENSRAITGILGCKPISIV